MNPVKASELLETLLGKQVTAEALHYAGGGCINKAVHVQTDAGAFFIKWNNLQAYPGMFEAEQKGLDLLRASCTLHIPKVFGIINSGTMAYLVMEYVKPGRKSRQFWERFGSGLAAMHRCSGAYFGLDHINYIGSLPQFNKPCTTWPEFFLSQRLRPQLDLAVKNGNLPSSLQHELDKLAKAMEIWFPAEPPALLHGDLWSGNYLAGDPEETYLIDPAVYFGHREMDLAMTRLFGGFDPLFYEAYQDAYPLGEDWKSRIDICNLYPLLVHVNLFGGTYATEVIQILRSRFSQKSSG